MHTFYIFLEQHLIPNVYLTFCSFKPSRKHHEASIEETLEYIERKSIHIPLLFYKVNGQNH